MASDLDRRFDDVLGALAGPGGLLAAVRDERGLAHVSVQPATLDDYLRRFCTQHAPVVAIVAGAERLTYGEIHVLSERLARVLAGEFGIVKGDRVAIAMRNAPAWIVAHMAVVKAGGIATLVNGWWTPDELAHALQLTEPKLVIADEERARRIEETGFAGKVVTLPVARPIVEALAPLFDGAAEADLPEILPEDDATILFTSGSTGAAKGAVATHRSITAAIYTYVGVTASILELFYGGDLTNLPNPPCVLVAVPLFHVTGEVPVYLTSLALARKMVLMRKWDAGEALRLIEAERVTYFVGVPTMSFELMQHPDRDRYDLTSMTDVAAGGAARPVAHVPRLKEAFPAGNPMMGYGLTETNGVGSTNFRSNYIDKPASVGRAPAPFVEIAIFGPDNAELATGEIGEIGIRTAGNIRGYWNDPAATARAFTPGGYFLSGDLGYLDAENYLFIVDRAKDIIIRGGENISCLEVEAALFAHPAILEASVFGLHCDRLGEQPGAVVHPKEGEAIDRAKLDEFLAARLARFKLPVRIWIWDEPLPKLGTGKVDKKALRARYQQALDTPLKEHA